MADTKNKDSGKRQNLREILQQFPADKHMLACLIILETLSGRKRDSLIAGQEQQENIKNSGEQRTSPYHQRLWLAADRQYSKLASKAESLGQDVSNYRERYERIMEKIGQL